MLGFEDLNLCIFKGMSEYISVCKGTDSRLYGVFCTQSNKAACCIFEESRWEMREHSILLLLIFKGPPFTADTLTPHSLQECIYGVGVF